MRECTSRSPYAKIALLTLLLMVFSACGIRQNNGRIRRQNPQGSRLLEAHGPFYSGTQGAPPLTTDPSNCGGGSGRPCLKMRASVGLPYQFDTNLNADQGPLIVNTAYLPAPQPYSVQIAGPGKVKPSASVRSDEPQLENKDLKLMIGQTAGGELTFP